MTFTGERNVRSDTRRNMRRMLDSARVVLGADPQSATMADVALHAEISTATAYRYFPSRDELVAAVVVDLVRDLREFSDKCSASGEELMRQVMVHWIQLILGQGTILIHLRSRRGYLERLTTGDPAITATAEAWRRPVQQLLGEACPPEALPRALMLLNMISDPREIRDLHSQSGLGPEDLAKVLIETFQAGVPAWLAGTQAGSRTTSGSGRAKARPPGQGKDAPRLG
jgi:AcrR family transcriptional regulator